VSLLTFRVAGVAANIIVSVALNGCWWLVGDLWNCNFSTSDCCKITIVIILSTSPVFENDLT